MVRRDLMTELMDNLPDRLLLLFRSKLASRLRSDTGQRPLPASSICCMRPCHQPCLYSWQGFDCCMLSRQSGRSMNHYGPGAPVLAEPSLCGVARTGWISPVQGCTPVLRAGSAIRLKRCCPTICQD